MKITTWWENRADLGTVGIFNKEEDVKKPTKNDAEMMLNDMPREQLPKQFQALIAESDSRCAVKTEFSRKARAKAGELIRTHKKEEFNRWYEQLPNT